MALLFQDGLDNYTTLSQKYTVGNSPTIDTTGGRFLGGAFKITTHDQYIRASVTAGDVFIVNVAFKVTTLPTTKNMDICMFIDAGNGQCRLELLPSGVVRFARMSGSGFTDQGATAVLGTSSGSALLTGTWYAFEIKVTIANSGSFTVKQDGTTIISGSTDTQATANANADQVLFGDASAGSGGGTAHWDDMIIMDDAGSFMNDFIGDKRIYTLYPTAEGNYSAWTPSTGTDNSALVDETPPNDDTDYVMSNVVGDKDTYVMQDIPSGATGIKAVVVNIRARKDDAGTRTLKAKVRSNSVDSNGSDFNLSSSYVFYRAPFYQNPDGPTDWTPTTVNAMEAGQEVVA